MFTFLATSSLQLKAATLIILFALAAIEVFAQTQTNSPSLTIGKPIESELKGGEVHAYHLKLRNGQFINVEVEQKGIDAVVTLYDFNNTKLKEVDSPNGAEGIEPVLFVVKEVGNYILEVKSPDKSAKPGRYKIRIKELRRATNRDAQRIVEDAENRKLDIEATNYFLEARQSFKQNNWLLAAESLKKASAIFRRLKRKNLEAESLVGLGIASTRLNKMDEALDAYHKSVLLFKTIGNKTEEAKNLSNVGWTLWQMGNVRDAVNYLQSGLKLQRTVGDKSSEATTLRNLGKVYAGLNERERAIECYTQVLELTKNKSKTQQDHYVEANVLLDISYLQSNLKQFQKALDYNEQAFQIAKSNNLKIEEAAALGNFGVINSLLKDNQKALDYYQQALALQKSTNYKNGEAETLNRMAWLFYDLNEPEKSVTSFSQSLLTSRGSGIWFTETESLNGMTHAWLKLGFPNLAIFYGKQTVNRYQKLRHNIKTFSQETQRKYLEKIGYAYHKLAEILISQGRIAEAEQVLAMLKEEEYFNFIRRDDKVSKELRERIALTPAEIDAFKRYEEIADKITALGKEYGRLLAESRKHEVGKFPEQKLLDEREKQIADANKVFVAFLDDLKASFKEKSESIAIVDSGTQALLKELNQPNTVIISTIIGEDKLNLIVTTADAQRPHTVEIKSADLNQLVADFRAAVRNPQIDPRVLGKQLYDVLFPPPLQKDLEGVNADTIVWSLDGTLRYVPMSALWDGNKYLVERYKNVLITLASIDNLNATASEREKWQALGVGVSKSAILKGLDGEPQTFDSLDAVPEELCSIIADPSRKSFCQTVAKGRNGVLVGKNLLDADFTLRNFKSYLGRFPVVHIASHFALNPGNEKDSYLLLGGTNDEERKLTLAAIREGGARFVGVDLLTLSACNTAINSGSQSNGIEIESFGTLAQKQGAKTVLATLWSVADPSTRDLMTEFYKILETKKSIGKAESLRQAQLRMLSGRHSIIESSIALKRELVKTSAANKTTQPPFKKDANAPYSHPFYWSPFILIGHWN